MSNSIDPIIATLITRYQTLISECGVVDRNEHTFGELTSVAHLDWMLKELVTNDTQSLTKKHRWLGYIQGLLIAYGITTVNTERDATRHLLAGA